jgi:hypothetical protein
VTAYWTKDDCASEYDSWVNEMLERAPDSYDDDSSAEDIVIRYIRDLEAGTVTDTPFRWLLPRLESRWLKLGCPLAGCDEEVSVTNLNLPNGRDDGASDMLTLLLGITDHLRKEHEGKFPWEDHPGQDKRVNLQLEPERAQRLFEILGAAGAHPSGLGSYEAANDALALRTDLLAQVDRQ